MCYSLYEDFDIFILVWYYIQHSNGGIKMKYGYANASTEKLIQNYKISHNKIVITFLDGSSYEIPFTKENIRWNAKTGSR